MDNVLCPFCGAPYTEDMLKALDGTYGCDTGCDFYRIVIECAACGKEVYVKGEFGGTSYCPDWRDDVTDEEIAEAVAEKREWW